MTGTSSHVGGLPDKSAGLGTYPLWWEFSQRVVTSCAHLRVNWVFFWVFILVPMAFPIFLSFYGGAGCLLIGDGEGWWIFHRLSVAARHTRPLHSTSTTNNTRPPPHGTIFGFDFIIWCRNRRHGQEAEPKRPPKLLLVQISVVVSVHASIPCRDSKSVNCFIFFIKLNYERSLLVAFSPDQVELVVLQRDPSRESHWS